MHQLVLPDAERSGRMRQVLQQVVVPKLRDLGFQGTMPHFRRQRQDRLDLLNIQFSHNGQYFFVNLGRIQLARGNSGLAFKPTKSQLNIANCPIEQRTRLTTAILPQQLEGRAVAGFQMWNFAAAIDAEAEDRMHRLAHQLREFLTRYAEPWWREGELQGLLPQAAIIGPG